MKRSFSKRKSYRSRSMSRIGRKTIRKARRMSRMRRMFPASKQSVVLPFRQEIILKIPNLNSTNSIAIARFAEGTGTIYGYDQSPSSPKLKGWE